MSEMHPYVLIVEADEDNRYLLYTAFTSAGWAVPLKFMDSGELALKYLQQLSPSFYPSLIILDMNMPGLNGNEVLALIRKGEDMKNIPIVFYSTAMKPVVSELLMALGAAGCFEIPDEMDKVVQLANEFIQESKPAELE
ncbi:response regulator [Flavisolibacter tropicus]|uniref:response regulator n=1 Tax=Flavisolibacter tropicus TaxID=1492898 RepID=UPI000832D324|nr:response regulator [Flavisolibacter tropicus]